MSELVLARIGAGAAVHIGWQGVTMHGTKVLTVGCGSRRSGSRPHQVGALNLATYTQLPNYCEKCAERYADKIEKAA